MPDVGFEGGIVSQRCLARICSSGPRGPLARLAATDSNRAVMVRCVRYKSADMDAAGRREGSGGHGGCLVGVVDNKLT